MKLTGQNWYLSRLSSNLTGQNCTRRNQKEIDRSKLISEPPKLKFDRLGSAQEGFKMEVTGQYWYLSPPSSNLTIQNCTRRVQKETDWSKLISEPPSSNLTGQNCRRTVQNGNWAVKIWYLSPASSNLSCQNCTRRVQNETDRSKLISEAPKLKFDRSELHKKGSKWNLSGQNWLLRPPSWNLSGQNCIGKNQNETDRSKLISEPAKAQIWPAQNCRRTVQNGNWAVQIWYLSPPSSNLSGQNCTRRVQN
jgi:hypothetical protein